MRKLPDFIKAYMTHTEDQEAPEIFHFWTALGILAAAVRRNLWIDRGYYKLFPNLYVIFVAESGKLRKSTAQEYGVDQILREIPGLKIYTERMTMEGIIDQMDRVNIVNGKMQRDACVFIFAPELVMLLPGDEISRKVMAFMTSTYMGKDKYGYLTKGGDELKLENVLVNFLGATAPDWLETLSEDVAKGGFLARIVFVTAAKRRKAIAWPEPQRTKVQINELIGDLQHISSLNGEMKPTPEFRKTFADWYERDVPQHDDPRVQGFRERQHDLAIRIAMLLSIAKADDLVLQEEEFHLAVSILKDIEDFVPQALSHIATSQHSRDSERVLGQIKRKSGKMTYTEILRANSWKLSSQEVQEVLKSLEDRQEIHFVRQGRTLTYVLGPKP